MKNEINISCIVIGHNSVENLQRLLDSINNLNYKNSDIEIIYIDDGSKDDSLNIFNNYNLKYSKQSIGLAEKKGRMQARLEGVKYAKGKWCFFINSNIVLKHNIVSEYKKLLQKTNSIGYAGLIQYDSKDQFFKEYLNHQKRGANNLAHLDDVPFYNVLFSNCILRTSHIIDLKWNKKFTGYGGEELEFFYMLYLKNSTPIQLCQTAIVYRNNHPSYSEHCKRLENFGNKNFKELECSLQLLVIKNKLFMKNLSFFNFFLKLILKIVSMSYKTSFKKLNFLFIKVGLWSSIVLGYQKTK